MHKEKKNNAQAGNNTLNLPPKSFHVRNTPTANIVELKPISLIHVLIDIFVALTQTALPEFPTKQ